MEVKIVKKSEDMPIDMKFLKCYLKIDDNSDEDMVKVLLKMSIYCIEEKTKKMLTLTTIECSNNNNKIILPYDPVKRINGVYVNGKELTRSNNVSSNTYSIYNSGYSTVIETGFIKEREKLTVSYDAGYEVAETPESLKIALLRIISGLYSNREALTDVNQINNMLGRKPIYSLG